MNKKNNHENKKPLTNPKNKIQWNSGRKLLSHKIPLELDLEKREILLVDNALEMHQVEIGSKDLDAFIDRFIDPADSENIHQQLEKAKKGIEQPIRFGFKHPQNSRKFWFEYQYQIVYVSYARTRLKGELIKVRAKEKLL